MEKIEKVVSDSGPLIHLAQIASFDVLGVVKTILISQAVFNEVCSTHLPGSVEVKNSKIIKVRAIEPQFKDFAKIVSEQYSVGLGEAESIALAKQENIKLLLTDDLEARIIAKRFGLEPHGTIGLVLRAFKEGFVKKDAALQLVDDLRTKSNLFITSDLLRYIINEIEKFRK